MKDEMSETKAFLILGAYTFHRGLIKPINEDHIETERESDAINYLCAEWDYACNIPDPRSKDKKVQETQELKRERDEAIKVLREVFNRDIDFEAYIMINDLLKSKEQGK